MVDTTQQLESHLERFALTSFRPGQREVVSAVLSNRDCLCIMPTGGGKSLCYQLPAVAREGLVLVVSPLIALMKDQVDSLQALDLRATYINSSVPLNEQHERLARMAAGEYDLVYIAPERLRNSHFLRAVRSTCVQLLAVDEAHCISEWGHDFRPDYARLGQFRERIGSPQTIALTATATPRVRQDVIELLGLRDHGTFVTGFGRPNLSFEVQQPGSVREKEAMLLDFLAQTPGAGIVYASTRRRCEEVAELLEGEIDRRAAVYHAGLLPDQRREVQEAFMRGDVPVIVATNAFGMGIDKADLRFVVHYNIPGTLEAYYQEAGRAGRDGLPSRCLLLFHASDRYVQEFFIDNRYPPPDVVEQVYDYLCSLPDDPIEVTQQELKEALELPIGNEGVGVCEQLLEKCGVLERLPSHQNLASVRLSGSSHSLVDLLPKEARNRRKVLRRIEEIAGGRRDERVFFSLRELEDRTELSREALARALRELRQLEAFDYVPPFRGRAVHMIRRDLPFAKLGIDFQEQQRRKAAEYEKLERVIRYAQTRRCRQLEILEYFGDPEAARCSSCDNCGHQPPHAAASHHASTADGAECDPIVLRAVRMALSGVARGQGRFGKQIIAQMLCGSKSSKMDKWRLRELSTFGLLSVLKQSDVLLLLDGLLAAGLLVQSDVQRFRPTVQLSELGEDVMRGRVGWSGQGALDPSLLKRLRRRLKREGAAAKGAARAESVRPEAAERPEGASGDDGALGKRAGSEAVRSEQAAGERTISEPGGGSPSGERPPEAARLAADVVERTGAGELVPDDVWTWRLLSAGFSPQECVMIRRLEWEQILRHVRQAVERGLAVEPQWLFSPEQRELLDSWRAQRPEFVAPRNEGRLSEAAAEQPWTDCFREQLGDHWQPLLDLYLQLFTVAG